MQLCTLWLIYYRNNLNAYQVVTGWINLSILIPRNIIEPLKIVYMYCMFGNMSVKVT